MTSPKANVRADQLTFESVARSHMTAEPDRQQAGLRAWAAALIGDVSQAASEGLLSLKELGAHPEVRLHPTFLWKLEIKSVSESFGGRPRYRLSPALAYLKSAECAAVREELRRKRRAGEQNKKERAA